MNKLAKYHKVIMKKRKQDCKNSKMNQIKYKMTYTKNQSLSSTFGDV